MRQVHACAAICALTLPAAFANPDPVAGPPDLPILTIALDFRGPFAARSLREMEREVENALRGAGRGIQWLSWDQASQGSFDELTVVRFNGNCETPAPPNLRSAKGPLGVTHVSNGTVLPFSDIACERIAGALWAAVSGLDPSQAELIFGRAIGRVVAHELVHVITGSVVHGRSGFVQPTLSAGELTCNRLDTSPQELLQISERARR
jgi:hypothetical protein